MAISDGLTKKGSYIEILTSLPLSMQMDRSFGIKTASYTETTTFLPLFGQMGRSIGGKTAEDIIYDAH